MKVAAERVTSITSITIGSLFSGIGGLELGLEEALRDEGFDCETAWQCEADAWCRRVLARHWPAAHLFPDVRHVGADAPRVDLLCGGFPCQDLSFAGKGAGLAGKRSGLWREFARVIRELRPRVVVVENVSALLSRGAGDVLGEMAASGYDAVWQCVRASDVGAPHRRERLFIVAWRMDDAGRVERGDDAGEVDGARGRVREARGQQATAAVGSGSHVGDAAGARREGGARVGSKGERRVSGVAACASAGVGLADPCGEGLQGHGHVAGGVRSQHPGPRGVRGRLPQPGLGGPADGLPRRVDLAAHRWPVSPGEAQPEGEPPRVTQERHERRPRLKAYGNAVVPQVGYAIGRVVAAVLRMNMRRRAA